MSVILITGSSTGIGYATAKTLAENGHTVYASMRNPENTPQLQQWANSKNLGLTVLKIDVTDDISVKLATATVLQNEKQIDVLINNAGVGCWGSVEDLEVRAFEGDMNTNYLGTLRCIKAVLPGMRKRKSGKILMLHLLQEKCI